jgi:GTP-binding protein
MGELKAFDVSLTKKPQILVANKIDLLEEKRAILEDVETFARKSGLPFFAISALKREGIKDMIAGVTRELDALSARTEKS